MAEGKRTDAIQGEIVHEYDGIEEADNELPRWWVAVFLGTIAFGGAYYLVYEKYQTLPSPTQELAKVMVERSERGGELNDQQLLAAAKDAKAIGAGKVAYTNNCVACHGTKLEGNIGPNLTDSHWLHGGAPLSIFTTVRDGVPAKGMPTWGAILGPQGVRDVTAYLLTLRNTQIPGKTPQGEPYNGI
jgi:cytochrome c oxidase cbb3-type subunit III